MRPRRPSRPRHLVVTGTAVAVVVAALLPAAASTPATSAPATAPATTGAEAPTVVTLLTGDVVTVAQEPGGERTYAVTPAPREDGRPVTFTSVSDGDSHYVLPSDAFGLVASGTVDRRLFDVAQLEPGGPPPVIVRYDGVRARLRSTPVVRTLESIDAVALDPADASGLWADLTEPAADATGSRAASLTGGVANVWLDATIRADLDVSVPHIGAPEAWEAGYDGDGVTVAVLDTGVDAGHPDLAGRITATRNFTTDADAVDGHGHGTHVAATVAGTGAAPGGSPGVAPGADLMIGKVLTSGGTGQLSWAIDGMEWAAQNGADVVNLSLSAPATDGTDPGSLAVDALSAETGTLFVVAAGNDYSDAAVGTPGAATSALTVGAVDDTDTLADFSNRGPRRGDAAIKPNLTAPGVGIVAARAAGTSMGTPVSDLHTSANGTSMATPHVAGAAALLAQAHPDWGYAELRDALASTAAPGAYTPFQQGAGRVDVARAVEQGVYGPASLDFGRIPDPATAPVTRTLTYRNATASPVALDLAVTGQGWDGRTVAAGDVRLGATQLIVPANGTATVDLTADPTVLDAGVYSGVVTATSDDGVSVRSPWSLYEAGVTHTLDVAATNRRGAPADPGLPVWVVKVDPGFVANDPFRTWNHFAWTDSEGRASLDVAEGVYDVYAQITTWDLQATESTVAVASELDVHADTATHLDARDAVLRNPDVGEPVDLLMGEIGVLRSTPDGRLFGVGALFDQSSEWTLYTTPTPAPQLGRTESYTKWTLGSTLAELRGPGFAATPEYWPHLAGPALDGDRRLPVVDAGDSGDGTSPDLESARDALALVRIRIPAGEPFGYAYALNEIQRVTTAAAEAGVAGLLFYADTPGALGIQLQATPVLQLGLSQADGDALRQAIAAGRVSRLDLDAQRSPERVYHLRLGHEGGFPADGPAVIDDADLTTLTSRYHTDTPGHEGTHAWFAFSPVMPDSTQLALGLWGGSARTELVGATGPSLRWLRETTLEGAALRSWNVFEPGERLPAERWFESPVHYGALDVAGAYPTALRCTFCRQGDRFVTGQYRLDGGGHYQHAWFDQPAVRLFRGDEELPVRGSTNQSFQLPPGTGDYRLTMDYVQPGPPDGLATRIATEWEFTSTPPTAGQLPEAYECPVAALTDPCAFQPLVQLRWDLGLDLVNSAPAGRRHTIGLHAAAPGGGPAADRLRVWFSVDDGASWRPTQVRPDGRRASGDYRVTVPHPDLDATNGHVWLRTEAWTAAGDSVVQTIERAYRLTS
ncbi:S8 family serine peptidase [Jiangella mangrovi]|uniref:Subtilisin family serine protease n=1 Tax=Jiangella mangrovi TaxID=1524084 RepID=A0A7W9GPQ8_9ACTN|nr:subtilisin family serine protease [Jiangella mangrovi]